MRITFLAAFGCLALSLSACEAVTDVGNVASNSGAVTPVEPSGNATSCGLAAGTLVDERTLFAAETAYNVPAHAYVTMDAAGRLTPELKARIRPILIEAYSALQAARAAYELGDVCGLANYATAARNLGDRVKNLLPSAN